MINQQLVDYIKQQTQAGVSKELIRQALIDAGWSMPDVEDSMKVSMPSTVGAQSGVTANNQTQNINPVVAMGGVDVSKSTTNSSSATDKFLNKPAGTQGSVMNSLDTKAMMSEEEHPLGKKAMILLIATGSIVVILAAALVFVYFNLNGQLDSAKNGTPELVNKLSTLENQVSQLSIDKNNLNMQLEKMNLENQSILSELNFFAPTTSTAPISAVVTGSLSGNVSTTFTLTTLRNIKISIANSKDPKVVAALTPLSNGTTSVTLSGTHPAGFLNLIVTGVNGNPL